MSLAVAGLALALTLGAGPSRAVRVDDPAYLLAQIHGRAVHLDRATLGETRIKRGTKLDNESMRLGRALKVDLRQTPRLVWEWKALVLPERGDVRNRRLNDQAARLMVVFEGMRGIAYVWDTSAPVGAETQPDLLEIFQRVLIVVRSGASGVGQWHRQTRDVHADYRRVFGEEPRATNFIGLESHSNDTRSQSAALFGAVYFEPR